MDDNFQNVIDALIENEAGDIVIEGNLHNVIDEVDIIVILL